MSAALKRNIYELRKENISVVLEVIVVRRGGALFKVVGGGEGGDMAEIDV